MANSLCLTAIWQGVGCSWGQNLTGAIESAKNCEIGLFLAQLYSETGNEIYATTALGAVNKALANFSAQAEGADLVYFGNATGLAFYAIKVAFLIENEALTNSAFAVLDQLEIPAELEMEMLPGKSGAISLLLALRGGPGMAKWHNITL